MIWLMAMAQLRSDAMGDVPGNLLEDLGFDILPRLTTVVWETTTYYANLADVWAAVAYIAFGFILVPFCCQSPLVAKIRFTLCISYVYSMRAIVLLCTRYPKLPGLNEKYVTPNVALGAVLVILGIRTTQTDFMFSGHSTVWTLTAIFFWHYRKPGDGYTVLACFYWAFNVTGMFLLIAVREHYTADVVVAVIISTLAANCYHLCVDARNTYAYHVVRWIDK